jgi:hypothetical protein
MQIPAIRYKWIEGHPGSDYAGIGYYVDFPDGFAFRYVIDKDKEKQVFRARHGEKFDMLDPKTYMEVKLNPQHLRDIVMTLFTQMDDFDEQP